MLRRLSLTLKDQKDIKRAGREVRGAAVPYHEPTSTDDDDDDDDSDLSPQSLHDVMASMSASPRSPEVRSWPSTPSTPTSLLSATSSAGRVLSPPPLELSARALLVTSGSTSSSPGSPSPPAVYLPQSRGAGLEMFREKRQSLAELVETGDVDGLKAALKVDASSINDSDEVFYLLTQYTRHRHCHHALSSSFDLTFANQCCMQRNNLIRQIQETDFSIVSFSMGAGRILRLWELLLWKL